MKKSTGRTQIHKPCADEHEEVNAPQLNMKKSTGQSDQHEGDHRPGRDEHGDSDAPQTDSTSSISLAEISE